jgi:prepilin-type N-terminal cleavage/methylation domain-containing protein
MQIKTSHTKGFTLVEVVVVVSLFTLLSLALSGTIAMLYRTNGYAIAQAYEVSHARRGIEATIRDIREMTFGDDGSYPLVEVSSTTIGFYSDIDRDDSVEYVRYVLATTTLYKYVYNAAGSPPVYTLTTPSETYTISQFVQNKVQATSTFAYVTESGLRATSTTPVTDIRFIQINVIINIDPNRNPGQYMLRSSAAPRNLKTTF